MVIESMCPSKRPLIQRDESYLSELVHGIYEAGVHPQKWNEVVAAIAASFGSSKALLFTPYLAPQHGGLVFPAGIQETELQLWATRYIDQDIWAINSVKKGLIRTGEAHVDDDIVSREEFLASAFYREFLSKHGIGRVCAGIVFGGSPGLPSMLLSVFRADSSPAFDRDDAQWMKLLVSHVSRAMGIMQRLDTERVHNASLLAAFDRLSFGVVLLNERMQVLHLNRAAQAVVNRSDGLQVNVDRQLEGRSSIRGASSLSSWLMAASQTPLMEQGHFLDGCTVTRNDNRRKTGKRYDIQCAAVPATGVWNVRNEGVRYVVFVTDPSVVKLPETTRLSSLYGLTNAQAQIAREFAIGGTYKQVARRSRISEETVHSHVKEIYAKTRVNREADLVRLVLSLGQNGV